MTRSGGLRLVLASSSAGRLGVLRSAGIEPEVVVSGVDETTEPGLDTAAIVRSLAERKAMAVAARRPDALVIGCDSLLDLDGTAYGKPSSPAEAIARWRRMSGRDGTLFTGHCLIRPGTGQGLGRVGATLVSFGRPTDDELAAYVASGEPLRVAGAFTLDGLGAPFIERIDGDPSNVIGLSLPLLRRMLAELGIAITELWDNAGP
ncbi:MAG TPA: Maf family protein [Streptosporangiaceae bacterium]|jgi:septum formation protein|nr:Maf family protein [Streptosporangiaceae bacterium]